MNNDLTNEISEYRFRRLNDFTFASIDKAVFSALDMVAPGARHGLQGIDSAADGVTKMLWDQAVLSAESSGALVFPQYGNEAIPADAEPVSFAIAVMVIAGRVARSILIINGMASGFACRCHNRDDWVMC